MTKTKCHGVKAALIMAVMAVGLAMGTTLGSTMPAQAQTVAEAVIRVNDQAITQYEINQRARMLQIFRAPGDTLALARKQLIEDRLKIDAAKANGIEIEDSDIQAGIDEFAERTEMSGPDLVKALESSGVDEQTFREFVRAGITWREVTQTKFAAQVGVSDEDLTRAKAAAGNRSELRVLLTEIIIVAPPEQAAAAMERAEQLAQLKGFDAFSAAARKYSAAATRANGGRLDWMALSELPEGLRSIILGLTPGQISEPIPLDGAIALFQLRDIEEGSRATVKYEAIEYATYYIPGGRSEAALKEAKRIRGRVDTCNDLYGIAKGRPEEALQFQTKAPDDIPQSIRYELAKLDDGEISTNLTSPDGQSLMLIMMCGRTAQVEGDGPSDEELSNFIRDRRIQSLADGYLEQLRSEARIVQK